MKKLLAAVLLVVSLPHPALAGSGVVTIPSKYSVEETMDRFEAAVKKATPATQMFARIDLQALAGPQSKVRPVQLIIFGRGGVLREVLPSVPQAAIDLPPKALAWQDETGKVWLAYNTGEYLADRHAIPGKESLMKQLTQFSASFAKAATE